MNEEDQALYNRYLAAMAAAKAKPKKVSIPSAAPDDTEEREEREQMEALMKRRAAAALEDDDIAPQSMSQAVAPDRDGPQTKPVEARATPYLW